MTFSTPQLGATHEHHLKDCDAPGFVVDDDQSTSPRSTITEEFIGTQDKNPNRLERRRRATMRRIEVRRAEEQSKEEEELQKKFQMRKMPPRSTSCPRLPTWHSKDMEHPLASQPSHPVDVGLRSLGPSLAGCLGMGIRVEASNRPRDARLWVPGHVDSRPFVESLRADGCAAPVPSNKSAGMSCATLFPSDFPVSPSKIGLHGASNKFQRRAAPYLRELGAFMQRTEVVQGMPARVDYSQAQTSKPSNVGPGGYDDVREDGWPSSSGRSSDIEEDLNSGQGDTDRTGQRRESPVTRKTRSAGRERLDSSPVSPQGTLKTGTSTPSTITTRPPSQSTGRPGSRSTGNPAWSRPSTSGLSGPSQAAVALPRPSSSPHFTGHRSAQRSRSSQIGRPSSSPGLAINRQTRGRLPEGLTRALESLAAEEEDDDLGDVIHDEDWGPTEGMETHGMEQEYNLLDSGRPAFQ